MFNWKREKIYLKDILRNAEIRETYNEVMKRKTLRKLKRYEREILNRIFINRIEGWSAKIDIL